MNKAAIKMTTACILLENKGDQADTWSTDYKVCRILYQRIVIFIPRSDPVPFRTETFLDCFLLRSRARRTFSEERLHRRPLQGLTNGGHSRSHPRPKPTEILVMWLQSSDSLNQCGQKASIGASPLFME